MRKKIKLNLGDKRLSFNGNIKKPYYLFIEMGEKQFAFSNKVKAKKWLVSFENKLNDLTQELIIFIPKLYNYNTLFSLNMGLPQQKSYRDNLDYCLTRYWMLYNTSDTSSIGRELNNIRYEVFEQLEYFKKNLSKNARNQSLLRDVKIDLKQLKYLSNEIDELFDVDKNLKALDQREKGRCFEISENYLRIA